MIITLRPDPLIRWSAAAAGISSIAYIVYALLSANGPDAGSLGGLLFGFAGTGIIIFECLLSLRKKYPASRIGRVSTWLRAHVWLGLLSFLLILFHSGFRWGQGLAAVLMWLFAVITLSGVWGLALQQSLPRRMKNEVPNETLYAQIPEVVQNLRVEADERAEFIILKTDAEEEELPHIIRAGGVKYRFDESQQKSFKDKIIAEKLKRRTTQQIDCGPEAATVLRTHYRGEIRPFLELNPSPFSRRLFQTPEAVRAYFDHLRTVLPPLAHEVLGDLQQICEERRQLLVQRSLHRWLHGWLFVHVPLSMGFLVLTLVHAVMSLYY
jgi:hypothetical protein